MQCTETARPTGSRGVSDKTRNIHTMIEYFTAWNEHDFDALLATFATVATYQDPYWRGAVASGDFKRYVTRLWAAFPDLFNHVENLDQYEADRAIGEWELSGTNSGSFLGLEASRRRVLLRGADMFEFEGGKIIKAVSHYDAFDIARQMGLEVIVRQPRPGRAVSAALIVGQPANENELKISLPARIR